MLQGFHRATHGNDQPESRFAQRVRSSAALEGFDCAHASHGLSRGSSWGGATVISDLFSELSRRDERIAVYDRHIAQTTKEDRRGGYAYRRRHGSSRQHPVRTSLIDALFDRAAQRSFGLRSGLGATLQFARVNASNAPWRARVRPAPGQRGVSSIQSSAICSSSQSSTRWLTSDRFCISQWPPAPSAAVNCKSRLGPPKAS